MVRRSGSFRMEKQMISYLWSRLESLVHAAITERILKFHDALIARGQIPLPPKDAAAGALSENHPGTVPEGMAIRITREG